MGYPVWRVGLLLVLSAVLAGQVSAACKAELGVLERHAEEVALYLYPVLVLELDWPGRDAPRTPGFGPTSTYGWLVTRFGRRGQLPAVTPPLPRGEQK